MNGRRSKWISKLFVNMDPGLILSMNKIYGEDKTKVDPKLLYRKAKRMWNRHDPVTKTWGKGFTMKFQKSNRKG